MLPIRLHEGPLTRALVLENPDASLDAQLHAAGLAVTRIGKAPDGAGLLTLLREHRPHLLFKRSNVRLDAAAFDAAPDLFAVMLCCIGDDSVDKQAAADRGIVVLNDPRSNGRSVAELVIGEILMGARRIPEAWEQTRRSHWDKNAGGRFEVKGKQLGIVGLGNIGAQVGRLAEGFGMTVRFHDNSEVAHAVGQTMDWQPVGTLRDLFEESDVVTVHVSAEDLRGRSNRGLLTRELLSSLGSRRGAESPRIFVNLARGFLYEPADLIAAVEAGAIRQAFVDVFPAEPHGADDGWKNPYAGCPAIHATPHIGAATRDAQPRIAGKMARTALQFSQEGTVDDCVFGPKQRIEVASTAESPHLLTVVHSDARGTKKAIDDALYAAGVSNLQSAHRDFPRWGIAYDVSVLDRPLARADIERIADTARSLTGRADAVRAVRQLTIE